MQDDENLDYDDHVKENAGFEMIVEDYEDIAIHILEKHKIVAVLAQFALMLSF